MELTVLGFKTFMNINANIKALEMLSLTYIPPQILLFMLWSRVYSYIKRAIHIYFDPIEMYIKDI
jgi:hypothetical protein